MASPNNINRHAQELLDLGIEIFEHVPAGAIEGIMYRTPRTGAEKFKQHALVLQLGGSAARENVVDAIGHHKAVTVSADKLTQSDSVLLNPHTALQLDVPEDPMHWPIRLLRPVASENSHSPGLTQASTLIGALPFRIVYAKLEPDTFSQTATPSPTLEIQSAPLSLGETRKAMCAFAELVEVDYSSVESHPETYSDAFEAWRGTYQSTYPNGLEQTTTVSAHFYQTRGSR